MIVGATFLTMLNNLGNANTFWVYAGLNVQASVDPEGVGVTQIVQHGQERCADDHIGEPVGRGGAGDAEIAAFQRPE
ncbi:hypothetical protein AGQ46_24675 [Salmonella enterica subsp. enterica]|nr:hypothetical protein AGQ46_24675 [Salmonella enterica subsp. enterica]